MSIVDSLGRIPLSRHLAGTLARAAEYARAQSHLEVSLEHLLLALTEDPDAELVFAISGVRMQQLTGDVSTPLGLIVERAAAGDPAPLRLSEDLRHVLAAAAAAAEGRRREIDGAIVLAAIVGDGRSTAANILRVHGLTFDAAIAALQKAAMQASQPTDMPGEPTVPAEAIADDEAAAAAGSGPPYAPEAERPPSGADEILASARKRVQGRIAPGLPDLSGERGARAEHAPSQAAPARVGSQPVEASPILARRPLQPAGEQAPAPHDTAGPPGPASEPRVPDAASPEIGAAPPPQQGAQSLDPYSHGPRPAPVAQRPLPPGAIRQRVDAARQATQSPGGEPNVVAPNREPGVTREQAPRDRVDPPVPGRPGVPGHGLPPARQPRGGPPPQISSPSLPPVPGGGSASPPLPGLPPLARPAHAPPPSHGPAAGRGGPERSGAMPPQPHGDPPLPPARPAAHAPAPPGPPPVSARGPSGPPLPPAPPQQQRGSAPRAQSGAPERQRSGGAITGQLFENIPRSMRVAIPVVVEARIARAEIASAAEGMRGPGAVWRHDLMVTKAMSVRLRAPDGGFYIENGSPETQWIENLHGLVTDDYASWRWTVTPRASGRRRLQLVVSARTVGTDGLAAETAMPEQVVEVKVRANYVLTVRRVAGWAIAALAGGLLARFGEGLPEAAASLLKLIAK
ncbi:MAG: Clp protease N-terminal domain-containing protein [Hyphomicrobiaceae bacterium]